MARSSSEDTTAESILMSDALEHGSRGSSRPRSDGYTDEDEYYYDYPRSDLIQRPSPLKRMLDFVGMNSRRRRRDYDLHSSSSGEALHGLLARPGSRRRVRRESRSCRKSLTISATRKALLFLPFVILMLFGVLHIIQGLLGSAQMLWDYDEDELFLPDWGRPGHAGSGLVEYPGNATRGVIPVACHSHNDYWRRVPLFEAIHWGCTSVEADIWLFDDDLFVGHDTRALTRTRSFTNLYVNPLVELLDTMNKPGTFSNTTTSAGVFDTARDQTLVLLVDIKSEAYSTYRLLEEQLKPLRDKGYLTFYDGEKLIPGAVTVVGTGNTPFDLVRAKQKRREIFFDAPLHQLWETPADPAVPRERSDVLPTQMDYATAMSKLQPNYTHAQELLSGSDPTALKGRSWLDGSPAFDADDFDATNSYYASVSFYQSIGFVWRGQLSPRQLLLVRGQVRGAKKRGLKVRYWETPVWPVSLRNHIWQLLVNEGADVLNVDDLKAAATEDWRRKQRGWFS